ncbi:hypothetical protein CFOL_v3_27262 [Cephalotus follicularis]|uniref:Uncharacterized protein n=1 Tax=Cephalotus follicularis TaxID=3775 RepID=A0A1Q3CUA4_CEPFO|nr:hypothetical protein CFOL_v3_27262 [Cephalotus follicularis]
MFQQVVSRCLPPYAATWAILFLLSVAVAAFAPETAFVSAIASSSSFSRSCSANGLVRLPLDLPGEVVCLPAYMMMMRTSKLDFLVLTIFSGLVVAVSACLIQSFGLYDEFEID